MKVLIIKEVIVSYSEGFYDRLLNREGIEFHIICQKNIQGANNLILSHNKYKDKVTLVNYLSLFNGRFNFQFLPLRKILSNKWNVIVITGNPRNFNNVVTSILLKVFKRKVVIWTMGKSYRNNNLNELLRLSWYKLFDNILLYTNKEVEYFKSKNFTSKNILAQNNGLDQLSISNESKRWDVVQIEAFKVSKNIQKKIVLLTSARLIEKNKFEQLIFVLQEICKSLDAVWVCIGDGDQKDNLVKLAIKENVSDRIIWVGSIFEENKLAPWFLIADVLVHTGAIGLTLLHAFGYGLPAVIHNSWDEHGPEHAAYIEESTGYSYIKDDLTDMKNSIIKTIQKFPRENKPFKRIISIPENTYNVDKMVDNFINIVNLAKQSC